MSAVKITCIGVLARPILVLRINGLWPEKELNLVVVLKFLFNILIDVAFVTVVLHNIVIAVKTRDVRLLNWMTCILLPLTNFCFKTIPLWINRNYFLSTINDLNLPAFNSHNDQQNKHIQTIEKLSKLILRYFAIAMTIYISIFSVLPFFINMPLMVPASFNTGKYDIIYKLAHLFTTAYFGINSASIDALYFSLIALCTAQLKILGQKLINILEDAETISKNFCVKNVNVAAEDILKECVILHDFINRFVEKLSVILSFPVFIQYAYGCFIICNTILQLTILGEKDTTTTIGLCGYSAIVFAQMSAYHWLGNEIIHQSNNISESCCMAKWYNLNVKCQKYLVILMERAKRPLTISLFGLVSVSLASLAVVVRWSYSVFALIKARYS